MIRVGKFGGTSNKDAAAIRLSAERYLENKINIAVISAVAGTTNQLQDIYDNIQNIDNQNERFQLAQENYETVKTQLILGMNVDPLEMLTSIDNLFDASISLENYKYEVVNTIEKLKRSIFNGDYTKKEGKLEDVTKRGEK